MTFNWKSIAIPVVTAVAVSLVVNLGWGFADSKADGSDGAR